MSAGAGPARPGIAARLRALHERVFTFLVRDNASPRQLAASVFVGAIVGATPFFGAHLALCVAIAFVLRLNQAAVYAAANISIPPMIPLLGFACVQAGERLLRGRFLALDLAGFRALVGSDGLHATATRFFVDWVVGSLVVGGAIGALLAVGVHRVASRRGPASDSPPDAGARAIDAALDSAARRYAGAPRRLRGYARFKYRLDPCYRAVATRVREGSFTIDLGTGLGMLPVLLGVLGGGRRAVGVDWDGPKLAAGRLAARGLDGVELVEGDARSFDIPPCDAVAIVDVLHYYDPDAQRALLARAAAALRVGGALLVREGDARRSGGAAWTRLVEAIAVRIGWNRGDGATRFRAVDALRQDLEALGLAVEIVAAAGPLHPGNVLIVATRAGS